MTRPGRLLSDRYRVDELIGRGGMASVHRGYDVKLDRPVAIKILTPELAADEAFRLRFRQEAQAASRMSHPTIVRVFDAGEDRAADAEGGAVPTPYIVMELVEGETLRDIVLRGPIEPAVALGYLRGILQALAYSHRAGVVHRDIKPGNVMITAQGAVKVMDFGIARAVSDSSSTVAETAQIVGTAAYFSPEQAKGEVVDARTDLYSAGVVLFEMLTGKQPFRGETAVAVAYQHVSEVPAAPSEVNTGINPALDRLAMRALAKDPHARFQSAGEFAAAIDAAARGELTESGKLPTSQADAGTAIFAPDERDAQETARALRRLSAPAGTRVAAQSKPRPIIWAWFGLAVLAAAVVSGLIWLVLVQPASGSASREITLDDLSQISWERAQSDLAALSLVAERAAASSDTIPEGYVVRTDPAAGAVVQPDSTVRVFVSTGPATADVPTLSGLNEATARAKIEEAGLQIGEVTGRNEPGRAAGVVLEVTPGEGTEVAVGSPVSLVVASGRVTVRDLSGQQVSDAIAYLLGLQLGANPENDEGCPATSPASVSRMSVSPGDVAVGSDITLFVCTG